MRDSRAEGIGLILPALMLLVLPLRWCAAAFLAAALHELCHFAAVRLCGGEVRGIRFSAGGAVMEAGLMSPGKRLTCILAGPVGGTLPVLLIRFFPRLGLCAMVLSAYNLLPLPGLDGENALEVLCEMTLPDAAAKRLCRVVTILCKSAIAAAGVYGTFFGGLGLFPLLMSVLVLLRAEK